MPTNPAVRVEGLRELRKALGQIDKDLPKQLRKRFKAIGDEVAADARRTMPVDTGKARASVRSGVSGNNAYVQIGKKTVPYAAWLDFGGVLKPTGRRRNRIVRQRRPRGRYLYPAIDRKRDDITAAAVQAFEDTARDLGLK